MKKLCRKITAILLSAVLLMIASLSVTAGYMNLLEFNSKAYQEYTEDFILMPCQEKIMEMWQLDSDYINVYYFDYQDEQPDGINFNDYNSVLLQMEQGDENSRTFTTISYMSWNKLGISKDKSDFETISTDEINNFLSENNYSAKAESISPYGNDKTVDLIYDENLTAEDIINTAYALYKEYGFTPTGLIWHDSSKIFINEDFAIAGDLDYDKNFGLSDLVIFSKYMSNSEIYPISDETARANADVNNDGEINSLDINILIEQLLGGFESAV